jgi:phosphatidylglycerophosphate synthase
VLGAALLASAWLSDFFDGRLARAYIGRTCLGDVDLWADTLVGAGAPLGLTVGEGSPRWSASGSSTSCSRRSR